MIDILYDIKLCLGIVFLIGLATGYFYIKRITLEEYLPVIKNFRKMIDENDNKIKDIDKEIEKNNKTIAQIRDDIKSYKDNSKAVEEDLLNVEHLYSQESAKNLAIEEEIQTQKKIEENIKKEYHYYYDNIIKKDEFALKSQSLKDEIEKLENTIKQKEDEISKLKEQLVSQDNKVKMIENNIANHSHTLKSTIKRYEDIDQEIKDTPSVSYGTKIEKIEKELKEYQEKLVSLKNTLLDRS